MRGLVDILQSADIRVVGARSGPIGTISPDADILMIDLEALRLMGHDAIQYVIEAAKSTPVLILTSEPAYTSPVTYLSVGASGTISKHEQPETLIKTIHEIVATRDAVQPPTLIGQMANDIAHSPE